MSTPVTIEFPQERAANRAALLAAVESIAPVLAANQEASEAGRSLAPESVAALVNSGLNRMKSPAEVGGAEAHTV